MIHRRRIIIFYILLYFLSSNPLVRSASDVDALIKLKKSFATADKLETWVPETDPCEKPNWVGVMCYKGAVSGLRLKRMNLSGKIDVEALQELAGLRTISFQENQFSGPIPNFNHLGALKSLYLNGNNFSGTIKDAYFEEMDSLKKLWLSDNSFSGPIPSSMKDLKFLISLHINDNKFAGTIPAFTQQFISIDFSNNNLEGEIPQSLSKFNASAFKNNAELCGRPLEMKCGDGELMSPAPAPAPAPAQAKAAPKQNNNFDAGKMAAAIIMLVMVFLMLAGSTVAVIIKRREEFDVIGRENYDEQVELHVSPNPAAAAVKSDQDGSRRGGVIGSTRRGAGQSSRGGGGGGGGGVGSGDLVVVNDEKGIFGLPDLMKAAAEVLGNGSLGSAYKAVMTNGVSVVVKRMRDMNRLGRDGFDMEMRRLGELHHRNILTPLAYHYRKEEKLVVYEFVPKGSLLYLLHGDRGSCQAELDWPTRLRIVQGIAHGMAFLHGELPSYDLPHGNLKSSNVFLGSNYEPLIADYGFWSVVNPAQAAQSMFAYKTPEFLQFRQTTPKCDVYCFGIIILEILTGKFPSQYLNNGTGGTDVVQWVLSAMAEGRVSELFDPEIASSKDSYGDMERLLYIAASCVELDPDKRSTMREVAKKLEEIQTEGGGTQFTSTLKEEYAKLSSSSSPTH